MKLRSFLFFGMFSISAFVHAGEVDGDGFSSEMLSVGNEHVHIVSAFDNVTYFTTYNYAGDPVWEIPFNSVIISWKAKGDQLFVFSCARSGLAYFLTCIEAGSGKLLWERPVVAPEGN
ncbi:MAG: hypothetical protein JSS60_00745 [Verrucomicrobia bacterium]|nr:hypothetical protein [Verrucomicrobiota bacterium]